MSNKFVLDSFAVLALVEDEPGVQAVADIVGDETAQLYMSAVNLGEVYYIVSRKRGEGTAEQVVRGVTQKEPVILAEVTWPRAREAARIKAAGGLSYVNAFALGLAQEVRAPVVTGDPEMRLAAAKLGVEVLWIGT